MPSLRATTQLPRHAPPSLSLWSLGDSHTHSNLDMMQTAMKPDALTGHKDESSLARAPRTIPAREMCSLDDLLAYRNQDVIERYEDELGLSSEAAEQLFADVRVFLYLSATREPNEEVIPTKALDAGWHEFLMFTQPYQEFCMSYFGTFVHHKPFTRADKAAARGPRNNLIRARAILVFGATISSNWDSPHAECDGACAAECSACRPG